MEQVNGPQEVAAGRGVLRAAGPQEEAPGFRGIRSAPVGQPVGRRRRDQELAQRRGGRAGVRAWVRGRVSSPHT